MHGPSFGPNSWNGTRAPRSYLLGCRCPRMRHVSSSSWTNRVTAENADRKRLSTSALVQFLARTQMSFGGEPERMLRSSKSESFETMVKPLLLAYSHIASSSVLANPH